MAIVKIKGKQYLVQKGQQIIVDRIARKNVGDQIKILDVLLTSNGKTTNIGTPKIKGAYVEAKIIGNPRGSKGIAFRYRPKKRRRIKKGYRAALTELEILSVKN